jgi:hypothetical protein
LDIYINTSKIRFLLTKFLSFRLKMENYVKSENKSEEPVQTSIHSINLDANVIHMNVKTGSKVTNLINFAQNKFEVSILIHLFI